MERGWKATGLLRPLWLAYTGGACIARRDAFAKAVGSSGTTLSAINAGSRNLGIGLARRIAEVAGVSVLDVGAPEDLVDARGRTLLDHLEELGGRIADLTERQLKTEKEVGRLRNRVRKIETPHAGDATAASDG